MNLRTVKSAGYWVATGLLAAEFAMGGAFGVARPAIVLQGFAHLGYPAYFSLVLGTWKLLGVAALLAPRFPRLKEWAYAGIVFDLTSAAISHAASGDGAGEIATPLVLLAVTALSWGLRPESRILGALAPSDGGRFRVATPVHSTECA